MKKILNWFKTGITVLMLFCLASSTQANHFQAATLAYSCLAPGVYVANLKVYRDCSGATAPSTAVLNLKSPGCNTGRTITMTKVGATRIGDPYCNSVPKTCTTSGRPNFEEVTFTANIYFTATEQNCTTWLLSWRDCCRNYSANLTGQENFYTEAMVNLSANIDNNSAEFSPVDVPFSFVTYNQPARVAMYAFDIDGDSLVYTLVESLSDYNVPIADRNYPLTWIFNSDSTKHAIVPAGIYSAAFPVFSFAADWSKSMPLTPVPQFSFDSHSGSFAFIPSRYDRFSPTMNGENKYAVTVRIDEYRKKNRAIVLVGSTRREMQFIVAESGANKNPEINGLTVNGQPIAPEDLITLRPGTTLNMQLAATDANTNDVVTIETDVTSVLPGATYNISSGTQPAATISWIPGASNVSAGNYYFHVTVKDNACPIKGFQTYTFGVNVGVANRVTGISEISSPKNGFSVYPNPFSASGLNFNLNLKTKVESIQIFNLLGQKVDEIQLKTLGTGEQKVPWPNAGHYAAGTYVAKLVSADKTVQTLKFTKLQ